MMDKLSTRQRRRWGAWIAAGGVALVLLLWGSRRGAPAPASPAALTGRHRCPKCAAAPLCELEGTVYECGSIFDWRFYTTRHTKLANFSASEATAHWLSKGIAEGRRSHAGRKTLKILLMTKDEWPLLRSWVLYHADLVGGSNL